ncbi:MAG: DUF1028 domain-containing protein [Coriobacteriia bacterium]|nr:DUF1028 domain-containing protein [Coriobacteriia bacterium]
MTFSIVGYDPRTQEVGVAVQSKFPCVGSVVPWAKAGVGAIATQAWANPKYGPDGLRLLEEGHTPNEVVKLLTAADPGAEDRQFGIIDAAGHGASFTGSRCMNWAGGIVGENFACQGNILVGEATVQAMARTFTETPGDLAERLTMALMAAAEAGGDSRGMQAAALYIARENSGYLGNNDRYVDIRVDENPDPIVELRRILKLYRILFYKPKPENIIMLEGDTSAYVLGELIARGYYSGAASDAWNTTAQEALGAFYSTENFEERLCEDGKIDREVIDYLKSL